MSENGFSGKKWDWSNPQNILAVIGIIAGLGGSVFGVAMAAPFGQDLLCENFKVACPRMKIEEPSLSISAIDFNGWCASWLSDMRKEQFPPPGFSDSEADCSLDFSTSDPAQFSGMIARSPDARDVAKGVEPSGGGVRKSADIVLVAHLTMQHAPPRADTPFSLRAQCWWSDDSIHMWTRVPCALSLPKFGAEPFGTLADYVDPQLTPDRATLPEGAIAAVARANALEFIERWRLDIGDGMTANIDPGNYRVEIAIGAPGEAVEPTRVRAEFNVYLQSAPNASPPAGTN